MVSWVFFFECGMESGRTTEFLRDTTASTELSDPERSTGALRLTRRRLARQQSVRFETPDPQDAVCTFK